MNVDYVTSLKKFRGEIVLWDSEQLKHVKCEMVAQPDSAFPSGIPNQKGQSYALYWIRLS